MFTNIYITFFIALIQPEKAAEMEEYLIQTIAPEPEKYEPIIKMESLNTDTTAKRPMLFLVPGLEGKKKKTRYFLFSQYPYRSTIF